jgi:hypothetical protein
MARPYKAMLASGPSLASRLAEVMMAQLAPCDLGDGIEVVHDVEDAVEIEMECDLDEDEPEDVARTFRFARLPVEEVGTHQFVRYSAPYDRIELVVEPNAFLRATIEEAKTLLRTRAR